jgi:DNA-binding LacI/PurR family transcriptional regulator
LVDIASLANVSRRAVSSVLLGTGGRSVRVGADVAERIRKIAQELGYLPNQAARQLGGKRSRTYGLLVASAGDPLRSFLVQYLDAEAVVHGNSILIGNTVVGDGQYEACAERFTSYGVDGVLCVVHHWLPGDRLALLARHPRTVFYEDPGVPGAVSVAVDRADAVRQAVAHLTGRGRKRIGLAIMERSRPANQNRLRGYADGLAAARLPWRDELVYSAEGHGLVCPLHNVGTRAWAFNEDAMQDVIDHLVRDHRADAIVAHDDYWAAAILKFLRRRGIRVPSDVAVVGYLNHYLSDFTDPPLTTLDLSHAEAAAQMVRRLEQMICGEVLEPADRMTAVAPRLIIREST